MAITFPQILPRLFGFPWEVPAAKPVAQQPAPSTYAAPTRNPGSPYQGVTAPAASASPPATPGPAPASGTRNGPYNIGDLVTFHESANGNAKRAAMPRQTYQAQINIAGQEADALDGSQVYVQNRGQWLDRTTMYVIGETPSYSGSGYAYATEDELS